MLCISKYFFKIREKMINLLTRLVFFNLVPIWYREKDYLRLDNDSLKIYPKNSLGEETLKVLNLYGLKLFPSYPSHDLKHILLGYGFDLKGEISMQFFEWGNGNKSFSVLFILIGAFVLAPDLIPSAILAFKKGRKTLPLNQLDLKEYLSHPLIKLRQKIHYEI